MILLKSIKTLAMSLSLDIILVFSDSMILVLFSAFLLEKERPKSSPEIISVHITRSKLTTKFTIILLLSFVFQLNTVISLFVIFFPAL